MARAHLLFTGLAVAAALGVGACSKGGGSNSADTSNGVSQADAQNIPGNTGTAYDATTGNTVPAEAAPGGFNQMGAADSAGPGSENSVGGAAGGTMRAAPPRSSEPASRAAGKPTMPH